MKNKLLLILISLITFSFLSIMVIGNFANPFNFATERLMITVGNLSPSFWNFVTKLGETESILIFTILATIVFLVYKKPFEIVALLSSLAIGVITTWTLKNLYQIERPAEWFWLGSAGGFSFPSGHTLQATAFFLTLSFLIAPFIKKRSSRITLEIIAGIFIFGISLSRVFLGVHWISDILAGWLLGVVVSLFVVYITSIVYPKLFKKALF